MENMKTFLADLNRGELHRGAVPRGEQHRIRSPVDPAVRRRAEDRRNPQKDRRHQRRTGGRRVSKHRQSSRRKRSRKCRNSNSQCKKDFVLQCMQHRTLITL